MKESTLLDFLLIVSKRAIYSYYKDCLYKNVNELDITISNRNANKKLLPSHDLFHFGYTKLQSDSSCQNLSNLFVPFVKSVWPQTQSTMAIVKMRRLLWHIHTYSGHTLQTIASLCTDETNDWRSRSIWPCCCGEIELWKAQNLSFLTNFELFKVLFLYSNMVNLTGAFDRLLDLQ